MHPRGSLVWYDANKSQARAALKGKGINGELITVAFAKLASPDWAYGPTVFLFDLDSNRAARVTVQGPEEFDVKVSRRTAEEFYDVLMTEGPDFGYDLDHIVIGL